MQKKSYEGLCEKIIEIWFKYLPAIDPRLEKKIRHTNHTLISPIIIGRYSVAKRNINIAMQNGYLNGKVNDTQKFFLTCEYIIFPTGNLVETMLYISSIQCFTDW